MAKFLPFVVEKSTPIHIYQTLIARSKGMNSLLVTSILYLVLEKGILTVRDVASKLPDMELGKLYENLLNTFPSYRITIEQFTKIQSMKQHIAFYNINDYSEELKDFELADILSFLLVMLLMGRLEEYSQLHFENLFNGQTEYTENNLIDTKLFSNDGKKVLFESKQELAAYIWFHDLILPGNPEIDPVKAIYHIGAKSAPGEPSTRFNTDTDQYEKYKSSKDAFSKSKIPYPGDSPYPEER